MLESAQVLIFTIKGIKQYNFNTLLLCCTWNKQNLFDNPYTHPCSLLIEVEIRRGPGFSAHGFSMFVRLREYIADRYQNLLLQSHLCKRQARYAVCRLFPIQR